MPKQLFVNLPVADLSKTIAFFSKLGFSFNPKFTDEKATCMIVGNDCFVMLLVEPFFKTFTKKTLSNAKQTTEVLLAVSFESRQKVDEIIQKAVQAGGHESREPQDLDFMYSRAFEDLDGHIWEIFWMDETQMK